MRMRRDRKMKKEKKAQISTTDMMVATIIFAVLVTVIMLSWHNYSSKLQVKLEREAIISQAIEITDNMVRTSGTPSAWNRTNVQLIGLASTDRKISKEKVQEFCNISYNESRKKLNSQYQFHFYISLYNVTQEKWYRDVECGLDPENESDVKKVVNLARPIIYKNETALFGFSLWR